MARKPRVDIGENPYHVLNRANARLPIFFKKDDFEMFEWILEDACEEYDMRMLAYCLMPNHFHLVLYPRNDGDMQKFMQWLTLTHTQRWHTKNNTTGTGHLYQGRYKSTLVQGDEHLLGVIRYVERNPLRADLVNNLSNWRFSSYWRRNHGSDNHRKILSEWPIEIPSDYNSFLHEPVTIEERSNIRRSVQNGQLYGSGEWRNTMKRKLKIEDPKPRGRPKNGT